MLLNPIKRMFQPLKRFAGKVLRHDKIHGRINEQTTQQNEMAVRLQQVEARQSEMGHLLGVESARFAIAPWYDPNLCEPAVQFAIRDLVRPGDTVFDVGANAGALSVLMSRLVGLRGIVCSFEASRRIVDKTQHNLITNACFNTQLYHRAIFHTSGEWVTIYHGSHLNDSIVPAFDAGAGKSEVETLALDDFVAWTGFKPSLIKMDIEGAEYDALRGAAKLIAEARPTFLLEQQPEDMRCFELLRAAGYDALDLATYGAIERREDFPPGVGIANVLFIHRDKIANTPYRPPFQQEQTCEIPATQFRTAADGSREATISVPRPGRYILELDFSAQGTNNDLLIGVEAGSTTIVRYHAYSALLANHYRQMPLHLKRGGTFNLYFRFQKGTSDPTMRLRKVTVSRIVNFDNVPGPLVD